MEIQLALDRFTISDAIKIANEARQYVDIIEIGTSLIKEFGVKSVIEIRKAFPEKVILADVKTFDNAEYEMNLCFDAGADIATVLGVASSATIGKCIQVAKARNARVMVDFASVTSERIVSMPVLDHIIWCLHVSKDEQEVLHVKQQADPSILLQVPVRPTIAIAGGLTLESVPRLRGIMPDIAIVGSYIAKAVNPGENARRFKDAVNQLEMARS